MDASGRETGHASQDEFKRPPRIGIIVNRGDFEHAREGSTIIFDNSRITRIADDLWSVGIEAIQCVESPAHGPTWQVQLVQPEAGEFAFKPQHIDRDHRNDRNDDRPLSGIVKAVPVNGFSTYSSDGESAVDARNGKMSRRGKMDGRMPAPGDTAWLGWLGWRCAVDDVNHVWPEEITCIVPKDGSVPWCMEGTCLAMLLAAEVIDKNGVFVAGSASTVMHHGIVAVAGENCGVSVGEVIIFRAIGLQNPTCPSPFGDGLAYSHVRAASIVAIDSEGPTMEGAVAMARASQEAIREMYANGGISSLGQDNDWHVRKNRSQEMEMNMANVLDNKATCETTGGIKWD